MKLIKDISERVVWTYVQTFLGLLLASGMFADGALDLSVLQSAAVAAVPAALAVLKGVAASRVGDPKTAKFE